MTPQALQWIPGSVYRLRDRRLAARLTCSDGDRLIGEVVPASRFFLYNGEWKYDSGDVQSVEEWNGRGNHPRDRSLDLMELMRP